jgi:ABC-2 type transport system ATP-binding protein
LDEPASGLDPIGRKQMRDLLKEAAQNGATIIISSHILAELTDFCDAIGILEKGKLVVSGSLDDIRQRMGALQRVRLSFLDQENSVSQFWGLIDEWCIARNTVLQEKGSFFVNFPREERVASEFLSKLISRGSAVTHFSFEKDNIEDIFFKIGAKEVA